MKFIIYGILYCLTACASIGWARTGSSPGVNPHHAKSSTGHLLSKIHAINLNEIKMAQMAESRSQSADVKNYANQLIKDHTDADQKVNQVAADENVTLTETPMAVSGHERMKDQRHAAAMKNLDNLTGAEFDQAFLKTMKEGHADAIKMLSKADMRAQDGQVKDLVKDILPVIKEHKATAERLSTTR